jgi:D-3-phosphoglycerate dehydrogenase
MMLQTLRPIDRISAPLDQALWTQHRADAVTPRSCVGATLGIIGLGQIGRRVAHVASALGMRVLYHDIVDIDPDARAGATPCDLHTLAQQSDVISIHVDGRSDNKHLLGSKFFNALRPSAVLINAARGFVIDTDAACVFARSNPDATLILDVHDPEPIPEGSALWSLPNAILTPHIAAGTREAKEAMSWVVRDVVRVLNGEPPHHPAY